MKTVIQTFILLIIFSSCTYNDGFRQADIARKYIQLIHQGKYAESYELLDNRAKANFSLSEYQKAEQFYQTVLAKYGAEIKVIKTGPAIHNSQQLYSSLTCQFQADEKSFVLFTFGMGEEKILDVSYQLPDPADKARLPFITPKTAGERVFSYYDSWIVEQDTIAINSLSLLSFDENKSVLCIKVISPLADGRDQAEATVLSNKLVSYALEKGFHLEAKALAQRLGQNYQTRTAVTFWNPESTNTFSVLVDPENLIVKQ